MFSLRALIRLSSDGLINHRNTLFTRFLVTKGSRPECPSLMISKSQRINKDSV